MIRVATRGTTLVVGGLLMALLTACTNQGGASEPGTPTGAASSTASAVDSAITTASAQSTSPATSPTAGTSESSASSTDEKLLAEAKVVNQQQFELEMRLVYAGGLPPGAKAPAQLREVMMGEALTTTMNVLHQVYALGGGRETGMARMTQVHEVPFSRSGSLLALRSCRDGRTVRYKNKDGTTETGVLIRYTAFFARDDDGILKVSDWTGKEVDECGR